MNFNSFNPAFALHSRYTDTISFEEDEVLMKNKHSRDRITINNIAPR
jgi:hypothetical protein